MTTFGQLGPAMGYAAGPHRIAWTQQNQLAIVTWAVYEGSPALWNPLDDTRQMPGSWPLKGNSAKVQNYLSLGEAVDAYIATLWGTTYYGYPAVCAALAKGDCACEVTEAIANSEWGTWFHNPGAAVEAVKVVNADYGTYASRAIVGSL
jgi:hypothetical protein